MIGLSSFKAFPSVGTVKVKCLERPFGIKGLKQKFEPVKFWGKYTLDKLFFCPITPRQVDDGSGRWVY